MEAKVKSNNKKRNERKQLWEKMDASATIPTITPTSFIDHQSATHANYDKAKNSDSSETSKQKPHQTRDTTSNQTNYGNEGLLFTCVGDGDLVARALRWVGKLTDNLTTQLK